MNDFYYQLGIIALERIYNEGLIDMNEYIGIKKDLDKLKTT